VYKDCVQCKALLDNGDRCRNKTCTYPTYCWIHTKAKAGVKIKKSTIPGAGMGLFATKEFRSREKICDYGGKLMSKEMSDKIDSGYAVGVSDGKVRDSASTQAGIGRYANTCRTKNKREKDCKGNNAELVESSMGRRVHLETIDNKRIKKGDEVLVRYGRGYWKDYDKMVKQKKRRATKRNKKHG